MGSRDGGLVLRTLVGANVQFVVVGDPSAVDVLRLVVARHPANLDALGRALDALGASLQTTPPGDVAAGPRRIGDPAGTLTVRTGGGTVEIVLGGGGRSLYADTLERAEQRDVGGVTVPWCAGPVHVDPARGRTGGTPGHRLLAVADGLAHLVERRAPRADPDGGSAGPAGEGREGEGSERAQAGGGEAADRPEGRAPAGRASTVRRPPTGANRGAGGAEPNKEPEATG